MNKQTLSTVPDENEMEELLNKIQPMPSEHFHQKMRQATWQNEQRQAVVMKKLRLKIAFAVITLAILTMFLITPPGRTWAQEVFQFFHKVDFTTMQVSEKELEWYNDFNTTKESYDLPLVPVTMPTVSAERASIPGCETAEKAQSYSCQIAYAESRLGFELMEFPAMPQQWEFRSVWFDTSTKTALIEYESPASYLQLTQRLGSAPDQPGGRWSSVPAGEVEKIKIGPYDGEYVSGGFGLPTGGTELVWKDTNTRQRVAWSDGTYWYLLESGFMNRDRFIELAASLIATPGIEEKQPDPDVLDAKLSSISEAEAYSGLDLKAPTLLPLGFSFSYAHYSTLKNNEVSLRYDGSNLGVNGYMIIYERKENSINFDSLSTTQGNYEIVKVNGQKAFYGYMEEGQSPYLFLWWREDSLTYQIYFYWYNDFIHGVINKQKMIAIAESIKDINVFKSRTPKSYESVKIYEEALGLDILEFATTPAGWSFAGFWFDMWVNCIGMDYTSPPMHGQLWLQQCGTDKSLGFTDIPAAAIEQVKDGKNRAQYVAGDSEYDSNGRLTWQLDLPRRRLLWQENGLWIQITVSGDAALLYDKESLISIAESLR